MAKTLIDTLVDGFYGYKRYLMRQFRTISEHDAEDIIQQTALKFIYKGGDLDAIEKFGAYICRALSNTAKDSFKKKAHEVPTDFFKDQGGASADMPVLKAEAREIIKRSIYQLDEKSRFVFVETVLKGRSFKELSEETGEPIGTLLSRKNRAAAKIRLGIESYMGK